MPRIVAERADIVPLLAEVFRLHGFEGASLARLCAGSGLGKGSLYHFFPGGKDEMASAVLSHIGGWFQQHVFAPLNSAAAADSANAIDAMLDQVGAYFHSGQKVCLVGAFALGSERDRFGVEVQGYFADWVMALAALLQRCGHTQAEAARRAQEAVGAIQGALVLARALRRVEVFTEALHSQRLRLLAT